MSIGTANDFSQYSPLLETRIRRKMAEFAGNPDLSMEDMTNVIQMKINNGVITSSEVDISIF